MNRILVALDVDSAGKAIALADALRGSVAGFKIGKQLFTAEGPSMVRTLAERGDQVFLDLKFHDIPNTVSGAVASAVATGAWMVNVHASGGRRMMQAAVQSAAAAAERGHRPRPLVIAVTVLTSMDDSALREIGVTRPMIDQVVALARLSQDAGLDGVVASPQEIDAIRAACGPDFQIVTPGIRGPQKTQKTQKTQTTHTTETTQPTQNATVVADDQARTMGPAEAVERGASFLVIGRPITAAPNPREAADRIADDISAARSATPAS